MPEIIGIQPEKPEEKVTRLQAARGRLAQRNARLQERADALRAEADRLEASIALGDAWIDKVDAAITAAGRE